MSSDAPNFLVINYDENNKSPNEYYINEIISRIELVQPDIFILTTQNSLSGTDSHIQHSIRDEINKSKSRKFFRNNTNLELLLKKYNLFSKIDATRKSNSKTGFLNLQKPYNVRTRIWINSETVSQSFIKNFSANKYTSDIVKKDPSSNYNTNTSFGTNKIEGYMKKFLDNPIIRIDDYSYERVTSSGENGRKGNGSIMINIILTDRKSQTYQYIICNINPKGGLEKNAEFTKQTFYNMLNYDNKSIQQISSEKNESFMLNRKIFLLYISKDNCVYKIITRDTKNNNIINLKDEKTIIESGLTFYQIYKPINEVNKSAIIPVLGNSENNQNNYHQFDNKYILKKYELNENIFLGLKMIIYIVIKFCHKPINIENINTYMKSSYDIIIKILTQYKINIKFLSKHNFDYNFILVKLNSLYNTFKNISKKNELKDYIDFWELIIVNYNDDIIRKLKSLSIILKIKI